jgi:hypothetical protein
MTSGPLQTPIMCFQCFEQNGVPRFSTASAQQLPDEGVVFSTCDLGHFSAFVSQQQPFELLSEIAIQAICDGYQRESVASFAAALERLYEFYVEIACQQNAISKSDFDKTWKPLKAQSERQLGAFSVCFLLENGGPPSLLGPKMVEFRNKVIHKGKIPSRDEAVLFGQAVIDCASPLVKVLKSERYASTVMASTSNLIATRSKLARVKGARISVGTGTSPFSLTAAEDGFDLKTMLDERAKRPNLTMAMQQVAAFGLLTESMTKSSEQKDE